jgi:hypothetical protein
MRRTTALTLGSSSTSLSISFSSVAVMGLPLAAMLPAAFSTATRGPGHRKTKMILSPCFTKSFYTD